MATIIKTTFKLKRGTAAKWKELNLVLAAGEPGFEIDTNSLKIGNGYTPWNELPYLATGSGSGEGGNIIVDTILSETSLNPIANKAVTEALNKLSHDLAEKQNYNFGDGFVVEEGPDGIQIVNIDLAKIPGIDTSNFVTQEELAAAIPTKVSELENDSGYLTNIPNEYITKEYNNAFNRAIKYEVMPHEGVIVDYRDTEIRINTTRVKPSSQQAGPTATPNQYYIPFRAYAPEGCVAFKEWQGDIRDETLHTFDESFAGMDEFGRNYSLIWMSIANYDGEKWNLYGDKSNLNKYLGFYYTFEWYDNDNNLLDTSKVRIILTNDSCHNDLVPDATARRIDDKITAINTTLEQNYITIEQGVTKEELTDEVRFVVDTEVEQIIDDKIAAGVVVNAIDYGSF